MQNEFGCASIQFNCEKYNDPMSAPAAKYVLLNSPLFQTISDAQVTVPRYTESGGNYNNIINEDGEKLLEDARQRAKNKLFKATLDKYVIERRLSGFWHDTTTGMRHMNTWNNLYVDGYLNGKRVDTSTIIFLDDIAGWVLTCSGSLYKLGTPKTDAERELE